MGIHSKNYQYQRSRKERRRLNFLDHFLYAKIWVLHVTYLGGSRIFFAFRWIKEKITKKIQKIVPAIEKWEKAFEKFGVEYVGKDMTHAWEDEGD